MWNSYIVITLYLHLPGSPDLEHGAYALSDGEAISLPSRYYGPDVDAKLHLSNELSFDAFRLAIVEGHIPHENIRWRAFDHNGRHVGTFNRFGVAQYDPDEPRDKRPCLWPSIQVTEAILYAAAKKSQAEKAGRPPLNITRIRSSGENCKPEGSDNENSS